MTTFTHSLQPLTLDPGARIYPPPRAAAEPLRLDAPALAAMTDLRRTRVVTIAPEVTVDAALTLMIHAQVRLLLVIDRDAMILGLVAAGDLMGDKPLRVASSERVHREAVQVRQVMTVVADIQPLDRAAVEHATVRDIVQHLLATQRLHALVIESADGEHRYTACGIFSATQIGRQLGRDIDGGDGRARSFAELERLIA